MAARIFIAIGLGMPRMSVLAWSEDDPLQSYLVLVAADVLHREAQLGSDVFQRSALVRLEPLFGSRYGLSFLLADLLVFERGIDDGFQQPNQSRELRLWQAINQLVGMLTFAHRPFSGRLTQRGRPHIR